MAGIDGQAFRAGAPSTLTASTVCAATGKAAPSTMPRNNERYSGLWTGLTAGTRRCCLRGCGLRMHAASVLGRLNERLRLRDLAPRRARSGDAVWTRACFGSTRQRECPERRTGLRQQMLDDRKPRACPGTRRRRRHCRDHRGQAALPAHRRSVDRGALSYCPASAAINDSGKPSRRNSAASRRSCTSRSCRPRAGPG